MYFQQLEFSLVERTWFIKHSLRNEHLAYIMDSPGKTQFSDVVGTEAKGTADHFTILGDGVAMAGSINLAGLCGAGQCLHRILQSRRSFFFCTKSQLAKRS